MGLLDRFKQDLNEAKEALNKTNEYCFTDDQRKALDLLKTKYFLPVIPTETRISTHPIGQDP